MFYISIVTYYKQVIPCYLCLHLSYNDKLCLHILRILISDQGYSHSLEQGSCHLYHCSAGIQLHYGRWGHDTRNASLDCSQVLCNYLEPNQPGHSEIVLHTILLSDCRKGHVLVHLEGNNISLN